MPGVQAEWVILPAGALALNYAAACYPSGLGRITRAWFGSRADHDPDRWGHTSVNVQLRKHLNLYAAVWPVRSLPDQDGFDTVELDYHSRTPRGFIPASK
jgi:hypothetical protein